MNSSRDQIEEIKNKLDIVDVISKYVQLKQAGKNFIGICPFHTEKTPSFVVSPEIQRYKCFGCGETGDIFNFIQKIENIDFPETLEKLAKEAGVRLEKSISTSRYERIETINKQATIFFYQQLHKPINKEALNYLYKRGITDESIKNFGIGYAPGGYDLLNYIQKEKKYSKEELISSGLFVEKEGKIRGKFVKRIMFPIRSSSGKVIAFTGRVLPGNDFGPKYMNSPETPIYSKKENFYGQYESRQEIRKQDLVILCEGTTDVISAHQIGVKNIVAPLGTALTKEQLQKISKLTKNILFLFDSDIAGQQAVEKGFILAQQFGLRTYAANTLPYKDLDEMIGKEPKKLESIIKKRIDAYTYLLTEYVKDKDINNFEQYSRIVSWIDRILGYVTNESLLSFYVKVGVNITKIEHSKTSPLKAFSSKPKTWKIPPIKNIDREHVFLQHLLYQKNISLDKKFELKIFENKNILEILAFVKQNPNCSRNDIVKKFEENRDIKDIIEQSIFTFSLDESNSVELDNIYENLVKEYYKRKERDYNVKIAIAEKTGNQKESEKLLEEFQNLTKEKQKYEQSSQL